MQGSPQVPADQAGTEAAPGGDDEQEQQGRASRALESVEGHTREVATDAAAQARGVVEEAVERLHEQANRQTGQVQQALERSAGQLEALADGRVDEAGPAADYARRAAARVGDAAERMDRLGFDGIVSEVSGYARRRPGRFLLVAAAAGVVVGRLGRSARSATQGGQGSRGAQASPGSALPAGGRQARPGAARQDERPPDEAGQDEAGQDEARPQPGGVAGQASPIPAGVPPGFGTGPAAVAPEAVGPPETGEPRHG